MVDPSPPSDPDVKVVPMSEIAPEQFALGKKRIKQIFEYLKALNDLRNPAERQIAKQEWRLWLDELPDHVAIQRGTPQSHIEDSDADEESQTQVDDFILKVRRPELTNAPSPPEELLPWLRQGWKLPDNEQVQVHESRNETTVAGETIVVSFQEDSARPKLLAEWSTLRDKWRINELPSRRAMKCFERLYDLYGRMERESERVELVLGDGILSWHLDSGSIFHPILLQRVELTFDASVPEFTITESDRPVELYSALFQSLDEVEPQALAKCRAEIDQNNCHPLAEDASGFLKRFATTLSSQGRLIDSGRPAFECEAPTLGRSPVIFLRKRTLGFNAAFEKVTTAIEKAESFPTALLNIVGVETVPDWDAEPTARSSTFRSLGPAKEILFGKPSNPEQTRIAKRLEQHGAVIVQGPPGTGKSHTIGNLIGHLLAQGQSILVTSHTTKALRVLRDHVVEELRPLCVSVLDNDLDSRQQLKESVEVISERLSNSDQEQLEQEAAQLQNERLELIERLEELQDDLLNARNNEYRDIVLAGESTSPSEAARIVAAGKDTHDWIPGPLTPNVPLPLSQAEVLELYLSNDKTTELDDLHVDDPLPEIEKLVSPTQFREMIENGDGLSQQAAQFNKESWRDSKFTVKSIQAIESLREGFDNALNLLKEMPPWQITVVNAGRIGKMESSSWELLIERIDNAVERVSANKVDILRFYPDIDKATTITEQLTHATTIRTRLEGGRRLGWLTLLLNREWRETIRNWKVLDMPPSSLEHFQAIERTLLAGQAKQELSQIWDSLIVPYGVETSSELGLNFVEVCQQFRPQISDSLTWWENKWQPLVDTLVDLGFDWEGFIRQLPPRTEANGTMMRIIDGVEQLLLDQLTATMCFLKSRINKQREKVLFEETESYIRTEVLSMREAISQRNATDYENSYNHLTQAVSRRKHAERRKELLERLQPFAECWVQQIRSRNGIHGETNTPGNPVAAWQWRQLEDELNRRSEINIDELITSIERTKDQIASVTIQLIDRRAWAKQVERTNLRQRQSLIGWLDTVRRMGKGHGKRVELLKREAQRKMVDCQSAVPAWIMPISRLVESFDFETTKFDVVIIDEASQCDVTGLLAITLGKRVVVVGDHEQVSPSAVGQTVSEVDKLIASCLKDIPNSDLYDGKMSIYDVARQSFGGSICLQEHFRCVPDIINFSNYLAYQGQIKPLRDETSSPIHPAVISYRVEGASRQSKSKINQEEAEAIASLIVAAIEHPMYADQTFGVINLLGSEQATEIEKLLLRYLTPEQYEDRRIVCGNSAQFQGDERDVIFLSMVDSPTDGPLPLKQRPDDQKRYNVAASRARNQMWVVHSLNSDIDLKPGDLRRRLIEHALDPKSVAREVGEAIARAESPFEEMVIQHLIEARYKVTPQWRVGAYRIDIVVEGEGGRRLAVECDGDRYHPPEKLPEDMARQAILERLGWTFHRLRGSEFFRTPDTTMERLFDKLKRMGIEPLSGLGEAGPAEVEQSRETVEAVIRRGAELRELWRQQDEADLNPENNFSEPENITTSVALPRDIAIASNDNDQEVDLDREGIEVDQ